MSQLFQTHTHRYTHKSTIPMRIGEIREGQYKLRSVSREENIVLQDKHGGFSDLGQDHLGPQVPGIVTQHELYVMT